MRLTSMDHRNARRLKWNKGQRKSLDMNPTVKELHAKGNESKYIRNMLDFMLVTRFFLLLLLEKNVAFSHFFIWSIL